MTTSTPCRAWDSGEWSWSGGSSPCPRLYSTGITAPHSLHSPWRARDGSGGGASADPVRAQFQASKPTVAPEAETSFNFEGNSMHRQRIVAFATAALVATLVP